MSHPLAPAETKWTPLYFLASLGLGGLAVSFFMYLMFWVSHPGQPVPVFEDIARAFATGGLPMQAMIILAMAGIAVFVVLHYVSLIGNLRKYLAFRNTPAYEALRSSNAETQLMAVPLALAMAINGGFVAGLVFVPQLRSVVEYLFPLAIVAFIAVGWYAFSIMGDFFGRVFVKGGFDCSKNNSFAQLLPSFTFGMIGVGLAAPASLSLAPTTVAISYIASTLFIAASLMLLVAQAILGLRAMLENGTADEGAPTLWVIIPIMTVIGIALIRQAHGMHTSFEMHSEKTGIFTLFTWLGSIQVLIFLLGWRVLSGKRYFARYVFGQERSAASYALVCPFVAMSVLGHFFINKGLVQAGVLDKYSMAFWTLSGIPIMPQLLAVWLVFKLNSIHYGAPATQERIIAAE